MFRFENNWCNMAVDCLEGVSEELHQLVNAVAEEQLAQFPRCAPDEHSSVN